MDWGQHTDGWAGGTAVKHSGQGKTFRWLCNIRKAQQPRGSRGFLTCSPLRRVTTTQAMAGTLHNVACEPGWVDRRC